VLSANRTISIDSFYLPLTGGTLTGTTTMSGTNKISFASDTNLFQDGDDFKFQLENNGNAGHIIIRNNEQDGQIQFLADDESGGQQEYFAVRGDVNNAGQPTTIFPNGAELRIGDDSQIQMDTAANTGIIIFNGDTNIQLDPTPGTTTGNSSGTFIDIASSTVVAGSVYYLSTSTTWGAADADSANIIKMLAVAKGTNSNQGMLLNGVFRKASHGFSVGVPLYVSNTAGALTASPNSQTPYVRVVAYAISSNEIYFCPDNTWVER
jgi:hypothetical protein